MLIENSSEFSTFIHVSRSIYLFAGSLYSSTVVGDGEIGDRMDEGITVRTSGGTNGMR